MIVNLVGMVAEFMTIAIVLTSYVINSLLNMAEIANGGIFSQLKGNVVNLHG